MLVEGAWSFLFAMMSSAFIAWFCSRCRKTSKLIFFFASMWTIPDLVQEIESIGRMLQVRLKAFTAGSKKAEEFEKGMLHTLCSKINGLNVLSIMDAQQLYQAISSSDLNEGQQSAISECIDAKLTEEKETHASSDTLSPQLVEHLATYLTNA